MKNLKNLVLITSIIYTPNKPLSYIKIRSVFTPIERFEQTKKTIQTIKEKIPNVEILMVECSNLTKEQTEYFTKECNYFINLINNPEHVINIYSISKSHGEGTMTKVALEYIKMNNIDFDNFFKITGRYWLSNDFNYKNFENTNIVIRYIQKNINNTCTSLYKLNKNNLDDFYDFLKTNTVLMKKCMSYEMIFGKFLKQISKNNNIVDLNKIGVNGYISVSINNFIDL